MVPRSLRHLERAQAALRPSRLRRVVDLDELHVAQVNDQTVVVGACAQRAVAAAEHAQWQLRLARDGDHGSDVGRTADPTYSQRVSVHISTGEPPRGVVVRVTGRYDPAGE